MKLSKLLENLPDCNIYEKKDLVITSITEDSRKVEKDGLFVAIKGLTVDGHRFIPQAISAGAIVIIGEIDKGKLAIPKKVTYIKVENSRKSMSILASNFYGNPSDKLKVIGVTGTDGKTTTASLIYHILVESGKKVGLVSTVSAKIGKKEIETGLHVTNPDPISLQSFLAEMVKEKCKFAVLEVTSHGIAQERVSGITFDSAVLTNISHEHLDYHKSFEEYRETKMRLFQTAKSFVVLNKDDESYTYISELTPARIISYSIKDRTADIFGMNIQDVGVKWSFELIQGVNSYSVQSNLPGDYNVSNTLAAIGIALGYGISIESIKKTLLSFKAPKGRMEEIKNNKGIEIIIDFAHTPNSLENVLRLLRKKLDRRGEKGKLIVVFGCAGERDVAKRAMMGEVSTRIADISVFTVEDPRSEDVNKIIGQMEKGARKSGTKLLYVSRYRVTVHDNKHHYFKIPERGEAISFAIQILAKKGDIVVICGKGHEKSMAYNGVEYDWSDHEAVDIALKGGVKEIKRPYL